MDAAALAQVARQIAAQTVLADSLTLRAGAEVVARVAQAPQADGRGLLALAGALVRAQLPPGVSEGATLRLSVVGEEGGKLLLRVLGDDAAPGREATTGQLAAALATRGDGELLRVALELAGPPGAFALPEGRLAEVRIEDEAGAEAGGGEDDAGEAAFVLHLPTLGAVEVRLRLLPGAISAAVVAEPGEASERAEAAAGDLVARLEQATGRPAAVDVAPRAATARRPRPPADLEVFDAYA